MERSISSNDRQIVAANIGSMHYQPHEGTHPSRTSPSDGRRYPDNSSDDNRSLRGRGYPNEREDPQRKEGIQTGIEDLQGEEDPTVMGDPKIDMEEDHLMETEDHLMEEDCLMEEDHLMMEDHLMEMKDPHNA